MAELQEAIEILAVSNKNREENPIEGINSNKSRINFAWVISLSMTTIL